MSEESLAVVQRLIDAFKGGEPAAAWSVALEVIDPELEMDVTRLPFPALARVYKGQEEIASFWLQWFDAWGSLGDFGDFEVVEGVDQIVVWPARQTLRGKGSGIEIEMPEYAWNATVRDGKLVRATIFMDKAEALEAAGLSE